MLKVIAALILFLLPFFAAPGLVLAQESRPTTILPKEQTVNRSYFASGNQVILSGTVNGDAYLAGGSILVDGTVNGDLLVIGGTIDVRGTVTGDIRAAGGQTTISGDVGRNVSAAGGSITIAENGEVRGDLAAAGGSVNIFGPVAREATVTAGQTTIGTSIGGDVNATGPVTLTSGTVIAGNLTYLSATQAQIDPAARVSGQITQNQPPPDKKAPTVTGILAGANLFLALMSFVSYLVLGLILFSLFPIFGQRTSEILMKRPWSSLGIGFLITLLTPVLILFLLVTILGVPLAILLLAIFTVTVFIAKLIAALTIGKLVFRLFSYRGGWVWPFVAGLAIYEVLALIPVIGWLVIILALFFGLGALFLERWEFTAVTRSKKLM